MLLAIYKGAYFKYSLNLQLYCIIIREKQTSIALKVMIISIRNVIAELISTCLGLTVPPFTPTQIRGNTSEIYGARPLYYINNNLAIIFTVILETYRARASIAIC